MNRLRFTQDSISYPVAPVSSEISPKLKPRSSRATTCEQDAPEPGEAESRTMADANNVSFPAVFSAYVIPFLSRNLDLSGGNSALAET